MYQMANEVDRSAQFNMYKPFIKREHVKKLIPFLLDIHRENGRIR